MKSRHVARIAALAIASLTLAGCGLLGDDTPAEPNPGGQQLKEVKVAVLPTMDTVPLHLAIDSGYFREEGLDVKPVTANSGSDCVAKLVSGEVQFAFSSYTPFFVAKSKGAADIKLVADATAAVPGYAILATMPNSAIKTPADLAGKRIAITARGTIAHLLVQAQLKANKVDEKSVQFIELPFPQMADKLAAGQIDVAFLVEPFIQQAVKKVSARQVLDTNTGPTADLALTGYGAKSDFVDGNRETVEKFQRVLKRATEEASKDRTKVEPVLQKIANIDAETAKKTVLTDFVSSLDPAEIQRVVDLMVEFKVIDKRIEVADMIVRPKA